MIAVYTLHLTAFRANDVQAIDKLNSACDAPSMNCAAVKTDATVVSSLTTTVLGARSPSTASRAKSFGPPVLPTGWPPFAITCPSRSHTELSP
jgi:hypothetical protein